MPLLHEDDNRGGGTSGENRHSLANFLGLDTTNLSEPVAAPSVRLLNNEGGGENEWRWGDEPGSPEVAQTPRAMVPPACFPPRHPTAFASFSESAQPGAPWAEDSTPGLGITDLVASLKALALPSASMSLPPPPARLGCGRRERNESRTERNRSKEHRAELIPRRASFCGVVSSGRNGGEVARWGGKLPPRCTDPSSGFSSKVFLGGLPWDISETALMATLRHFQPLRLEWPGCETRSALRGYAYVTFECERRVRALLAACRRDGHEWYFRFGSRRTRTKEVQVIPWALSDSNWVVDGSGRLEPSRTVFVGALHGMLSASALATIMNDLFSGVVYAGIDTDKHKYPIGSGRVTFNNVRSYVRAISAAYVEIHTDKFTKKVQVNPYLEDSMCSMCNMHAGPYFCREPTCFGYFCRACWDWQHSTENHVPLVRNSKSSGGGSSRPPAQSSPSEHGSLFNGMFAHPNEGTPSPEMSGTSGTSEEVSGAGEDAAESGWLH